MSGAEKRATHPFLFSTQVNLVELTGLKASDLAELLHHLKKVPPSVIYHHTHHFLKQHQFLSPEPTNDFAFWVTTVLQEDRLGEQLAAIDTIKYTSIVELRHKIITIIEKYLSEVESERRAPENEEFHFMKSLSFIMPTPHVVYTLAEFSDVVKKISVHSLYHHIFEARLRLKRGTNDFSNWLDDELQEKELAQAIARLDPYTQTLEALRDRIVLLMDRGFHGPS